MTKLLKILGAFALVLIIIFGLLVFNANSIVNKFRPQIQSIISSSVNQAVTIGGLSLRVFPSVAIEVQDVGLESTEDTLVKRLFLETPLLKLLGGNVTVNTISFDDVVLNVSRDKLGTVYIAGIPVMKQVGDPKNQTVKPEKQIGATKQEGDDAHIAIALNNIKLNNIQVRWEDNFVSPPQTIVISDLSADLSDVDSTGKAKVNLHASLLGRNKDNFRIEGLIGNPFLGHNIDAIVTLKDLDLSQIQNIVSAYGVALNDISLSETLDIELSAKSGDKGLYVAGKVDANNSIITYGDLFKKPKNTTLLLDTKGNITLPNNISMNQVRLNIGNIIIDAPTSINKNGEIITNLNVSKFPLSELEKFIPTLAPYTLKGDMETNIKIEIKTSTPQVNGNVQLKNLKADLLGSTFESSLVDIELQPDNISLKPTSLSAFDGTLNLDGSISTGSQKLINASISSDKLSAEEISKVVLKDSKFLIHGEVNNLHSKIQADINNFLPTAVSPTQIIINNGGIKGFNLLGDTLGKIGRIPGIGASLIESVPEEHIEATKSDETAFSRLILQSNLSDGKVSIRQAALEHPLYVVNAGGAIDLEGGMDLNAQLRITKLLSEGMILKEPKMKLLLDEQGNLVFPVLIKTEGGRTQVLPDTELLIRRAAANTAKDATGRALDKVAPGLGGAGKAIDSIFR
jgi:hypothetical protein